MAIQAYSCNNVAFKLLLSENDPIYANISDLSRGARYVPVEVSEARQKGERVVFIQKCLNPCCWYWQFEDGRRFYHWDKFAYMEIAKFNGVDVEAVRSSKKNKNAGPCPVCYNKNTNGGWNE